MARVFVVGIGVSAADLTSRALEVVSRADVLVGGRRLLDLFPDHPGRRVVIDRHWRAALDELNSIPENLCIAVLASGDPNFFGIGPRILEAFGPEAVEFLPNVSAAQVAFSRLKLPWQDALVVSLHGRGWDALGSALMRSRKLAVYTDPDHTPAHVARFLLDHGLTGMEICVLEDMGSAEERIRRLTLEDAEKSVFSPMNVVVLTSIPGEPAPPAVHPGMPDSAYEHEAGLITKQEVRAVALAKLGLRPDHTVWDLGAGSGSVGMEAATLVYRGKVICVERKPERVAQILSNARRYQVTNLEVVSGSAPQALEGLSKPDRVFIGGGGLGLSDLLNHVVDVLEPEGRVVVSAALFESCLTARAVLARRGWTSEVCLVQASRGKPMEQGIRLEALNPIWLITGSGCESGMSGGGNRP